MQQLRQHERVQLGRSLNVAIGILQLSDIHLKSCDNPVCGRLSHIGNAVQGVTQDISDILLLVTGDVAYSGKQDEYMLATAFLGGVEGRLRDLPGVNFLGTVVIPGNHDCDFGNQGSVRTLLLNSVGPTTGEAIPAKDFVDQMLEVQKAFFEFEALISLASPTDRLFWSREFETASGKVTVRCLNTAWVSQMEEAPELTFPVALVSQDVPESELVLTILHHPYNWIQPDNARALKKAVETTSDLVLTGHEHEGDAYTKVASGGASTNYVEGAALQPRGGDEGFNYLRIDPDAKAYRVHQFRWTGEMYHAHDTSCASFTRNLALLEHRFINNSEFRDVLEDPGTPFSHPTKNPLKLRDLFVYPDLTVTRLKASAVGSGAQTIHSHDVLDFVLKNRKTILAGPPNCGRTSLAKALYVDLQQKHKLVPVLLSPSDLRGVESSQVVAAVERAFERQYSPKLLEKFSQLNLESKAVIVDDWHRLKFNLKGKASIVAALERSFGKLVLISDDASILRQAQEIDGFKCFAEFEHCEIQQFGRRLRGELVIRWHSLGREIEIDEMELTAAVASSENLLDTLIAGGIVPSFPVYVLSVLQVGDRVTGQNVTYGSYGHIYESLLTERMARVNKKKLGEKYTYLSFAAYRMLQAGKAGLNMEDLRVLHQQYWQSYMCSVDQDVFIDELVRSQILNKSGNEISFQHKYAYYFFVAKYFQEGMADISDSAALSARLRTMADEAYDDENARIIIFYLYLTKDRALIEHILSNAAAVFGGYSPCDLSVDVAFVNRLYTSRPTVVAPSIDTRKNREEFRRRQDEALCEGETKSTERSADSLQIDLAFESLQIMGQVLRNFPGNLKADLKVRLAKQSYALAFRALKKFLCDFESNLSQLQEVFLRHLREQGTFARREVEEVKHAADKVVVALAEIMIFAVIKKVSLCVGLEDLRDIYGAVRGNAGEGHIATRLLDLSITLDHFKQLPIEDVRDLEVRVRDNIAIHTVLRLLVAQHLALFPVNYKLRQSMVQLFNFAPRPLLLAEKVTQVAVSR